MKASSEMVGLLLIICSTVTVVLASEYEAPIIGIVTQELHPALEKFYPSYASYIPASYVKAVESSGARVMPIPINRTESYYRHVLNSINGILLIGGSAFVNPGCMYYDTLDVIYKIVNEINEGKVFPILAVGYEHILKITNDHEKILVLCNVQNENPPLNFTVQPSETVLFANASKQMISNLSSNSTVVIVSEHKFCILPEVFSWYPPLIDHWNITSTTMSKTNFEYIATVEHMNKPYFGIQFHPEKVAFEWPIGNNYPHSREALAVSRHFFDTLVNFSRKNFNKFQSTEEEAKSLIYNYDAVISPDASYEQIYIF